jgi:hypothetical protein
MVGEMGVRPWLLISVMGDLRRMSPSLPAANKANIGFLFDRRIKFKALC